MIQTSHDIRISSPGKWFTQIMSKFWFLPKVKYEKNITGSLQTKEKRRTLLKMVLPVLSACVSNFQFFRLYVACQFLRQFITAVFNTIHSNETYIQFHFLVFVFSHSFHSKDLFISFSVFCCLSFRLLLASFLFLFFLI